MGTQKIDPRDQEGQKREYQISHEVEMGKGMWGSGGGGGQSRKTGRRQNRRAGDRGMAGRHTVGDTSSALKLGPGSMWEWGREQVTRI